MVTRRILFQFPVRLRLLLLPLPIFLLKFLFLPQQAQIMLLCLFIPLLTFLHHGSEVFFLAFLLQQTLAQFSPANIDLLLHRVITLLPCLSGSLVVEKFNHLIFAVLNPPAATGNLFLDFLILRHNLDFLFFYRTKLLFKLRHLPEKSRFLLPALCHVAINFLLARLKMLFTLFGGMNLFPQDINLPFQFSLKDSGIAQLIPERRKVRVRLLHIAFHLLIFCLDIAVRRVRFFQISVRNLNLSRKLFQLLLYPLHIHEEHIYIVSL